MLIARRLQGLEINMQLWFLPGLFCLALVIQIRGKVATIILEILLKVYFLCSPHVKIRMPIIFKSLICTG